MRRSQRGAVQQGLPQTRRPSGHSVGPPPSAQVTLQLPTLMQLTEHAPVHFTVQLPTLSHTALPSSPSVVEQVLALLHAYTQPAPHRASQTLALEHCTSQLAPQSTEQSVPLAHLKSQPSAHVASQSSTPLHVGAQSSWSPQSSSQRSPSMHSHGASTQGTGGPQHANKAQPAEAKRTAKTRFSMAGAYPPPEPARKARLPAYFHGAPV